MLIYLPALVGCLVAVQQCARNLTLLRSTLLRPNALVMRRSRHVLAAKLLYSKSPTASVTSKSIIPLICPYTSRSGYQTAGTTTQLNAYCFDITAKPIPCNIVHCPTTTITT